MTSMAVAWEEHLDTVVEEAWNAGKGDGKRILITQPYAFASVFGRLSAQHTETLHKVGSDICTACSNVECRASLLPTPYLFSFFPSGTFGKVLGTSLSRHPVVLWSMTISDVCFSSWGRYGLIQAVLYCRTPHIPFH